MGADLRSHDAQIMTRHRVGAKSPHRVNGICPRSGRPGATEQVNKIPWETGAPLRSCGSLRADCQAHLSRARIASVRGTGPVEGFVLDLKKVWRRYQP
jgi:hypothetical protein